MTRLKGDPLASEKTPANILTRQDADRDELDDGGRFWLTQEAGDGRFIRFTESEANVSSPPTAAELESLFGPAGLLAPGFSALIDDAGAGSTCWYVRAIGGAFFYEQLTLAT